MTTLLIATRNAHKVGEIRAILGGQFQYLTLNDFPVAPAVVEDAETFAGNATKKAVELAKWIRADSAIQRFNDSTYFVLADDSGLEVDALTGVPGVHSARFAALDKNENSPDADNNAKLLHLLQGVPPEKRTGRFRCVIALVPVQPATRNPQPALWSAGSQRRPMPTYWSAPQGATTVAMRSLRCSHWRIAALTGEALLPLEKPCSHWRLQSSRRSGSHDRAQKLTRQRYSVPFGLNQRTMPIVSRARSVPEMTISSASPASRVDGAEAGMMP